MQKAQDAVAVLQAKNKRLESKCESLQKEKERAESDIEESRTRMVIFVVWVAVSGVLSLCPPPLPFLCVNAMILDVFDAGEMCAEGNGKSSGC